MTSLSVSLNGGEGAEEEKTERGLTSGAQSQAQAPVTAQDEAPADNQDEEAKNEEAKSVPQTAE